MSIFVTNLATMIGLALAIDYSLFLVSRFREELLHHPVDKAVERTMATVGKAVAVSRDRGGDRPGGADRVRGRRTALDGHRRRGRRPRHHGLRAHRPPALLGMLGHRVNRLQGPAPALPPLRRGRSGRGRAAPRATASGRGSRPGSCATRCSIGGPILVLLLLAGTPFLRIELSTGGNLEDLPDTPAKEGFIVLARRVPRRRRRPDAGRGHLRAAWPTSTDGGLTPERIADLEAYVDEVGVLEGVPSIESVLDPPPGRPADQYLAVLALPRRPVAAGPRRLGDPDGRRRHDQGRRSSRRRSPTRRPAVRWSDEVRDVPDPPGATVGRGRPRRPLGATSWPASGRACRWRSRSSSRSPSIVLFLTFGSVFLPVKAVLMSLVSHHRQLRRPGLDLPGGEPVRAARLRGHRVRWRLAADPDVRDPVRAVDGLRGPAPVPDPRAVGRDRGQHPIGGGGDRDHRRDHHRRGADHGRRLLAPSPCPTSCS